MRKILSALLLVFSLFLLLSVKPSFAKYQQNYTAPNVNSDVVQNQHTWVQSIMLESMSALSCQLTGVDPLSANNKCLGFDTKTGKLGYVDGNGWLVGFASSAIGQLYIMPVHTADYVRHLAGNFGFAKNSYAANADLGFDSLTPLQPLWSTFRNFVYAAFIVIFLILGVAIMFRVKIDPRTVMTLQNQIPRIIIGIILVTFSLAIAGLLIDLMYVSCYLAVNIFMQAEPGLFKETAGTIVGSTNPFDGLYNTLSSTYALPDITQNAAGTIGGHLGDLFDNVMGRGIVGLLGGIFGIIIGGTVGNLQVFGTGGAGIGALIGGAAGSIFGAAFAPQVMGTVISMIAFLVIAVAVIASLFRLWFQLILAYIGILIDIVFAPFWIVAGLIPGSKINFSSWIRNLAANLAAFQAVLILFMLAKIFIYEFGKGGSATYFTPPLIGNPANSIQLGSIIALGLILISPSVVKMMKTVFGAPQAGFGPVFEGLTTGFGIIATPTRKLTGSLFGKNPYTGAPGAGSRILGTFMRTKVGGAAGAWAQLLTGGGRQGAGHLTPQRLRNWRTARRNRGGAANQQPPAPQNNIPDNTATIQGQDDTEGTTS